MSRTSGHVLLAGVTIALGPTVRRPVKAAEQHELALGHRTLVRHRRRAEAHQPDGGADRISQALAGDGPHANAHGAKDLADSHTLLA